MKYQSYQSRLFIIIQKTKAKTTKTITMHVTRMWQKHNREQNQAWGCGTPCKVTNNQNMIAYNKILVHFTWHHLCMYLCVLIHCDVWYWDVCPCLFIYLLIKNSYLHSYLILDNKITDSGCDISIGTVETWLIYFIFDKYDFTILCYEGCDWESDRIFH